MNNQQRPATESEASNIVAPFAIRILLFLFAISAFGLYAVWLVNPFPNEYREGASLYAVNLMTQGINPFSEQAPESFFYMYGFIGPWMVSLVQRVLGDHGFLCHRLFSLACLTAAALVVEAEARRLSRGRFPRGMAFLLLLPAGWITHELVSRPDNLALLLFVLAATLLNRSRHWYGAVVPAVCILLSFYTKQYFVLMVVPMFVGALLVSWRKALVFGFVFTFLFFPSLVVVKAVFPHYFPMAVLAFGKSPLAWPHLARQCAAFGLFYWPLIVVVGWWAARALPRSKFTLEGFWNVNGPLMRITQSAAASSEREGSLASYAVLLVVNSVLLIPLGANKGAVLTYFYQLLLPPLILLASAAFSRDFRFRPGLLYCVCFFSVFHMGGFYAFTPPLAAAERQAWREAEALIASAGRSAKLESALFVGPALKNEVACFDCGLFAAEWLSKSYESLQEKRSFLRTLFPSAPDLIERCGSYTSACAETLHSGGFSLVVTDQYRATDDKTLLRLGYTKVKTLRLRSGRQVWPVDFWIRDARSYGQ